MSVFTNRDANFSFDELRTAALITLAECDVDRKLKAMVRLDAQAKTLAIDSERRLDAKSLASSIDALTLPGRPARPVLVRPSQVAQRSLGSAEGRAALIHALAHIEFNAINLALDAVWRFSGLPASYYQDWLQVAIEEAQHFDLLRTHLRRLGSDYGDFVAHDGLWEMAEKTVDDVLARLALVPRTLEARGLDACPQVRAKLAQAGDHAAAEIVDKILRDEIGHVATGNRWYRYICTQRSLDPIQCFDELVIRYRAPQLRGPFNLSARLQAGFEEAELSKLQALDKA